MAKGLFVVFEGADGSGKSTQIKLLTHRLKKLKQPVILSREPGGTPLGEKIRRLYKGNDLDPITRLFLLEASRRLHVKEKIVPALKKGNLVISDRFQESSVVFQGFVGKLGPKKIVSLNHFTTDGLYPHLIIIMDPTNLNDLKKRRLSRRALDHQDKAGDAYHQKIVAAYRKIPALYKELKIPSKVVLIPSMGSKKEIHEKIWSHIEKIL